LFFAILIVFIFSLLDSDVTLKVLIIVKQYIRLHSCSMDRNLAKLELVIETKLFDKSKGLLVLLLIKTKLFWYK